MKLFELSSDVLSEEEIHVLKEGLAVDPELKDLITKQLAQPFNRGKQEIIQRFIPKLKNWAIQATSNGANDKSFISKVMNNPEMVAKQLLDSISSRTTPQSEQSSTASTYRFKRGTKTNVR